MEKIVLPSETTDNILDRRYASAGDVQSIDRQSPAISPEDPSESPSMVSFSMSDGSNVSKLTVDDSGRSYFQETAAGGIFRVDGRGKKTSVPSVPKAL
jgi:streptogramin lyase